MTGNDTIMFRDRILTDLADGNCVELTFPNEIASVKTGKNGNTIYGLNEMGENAEVKIRIIRGSADDKYLNGQLAAQKNDFAGFTLVDCVFTKKVGDGQGNITNDQYITNGGVFQKRVEAKQNVEGDTEQSVAIYSLKFAKAPRSIG